MKLFTHMQDSCPECKHVIKDTVVIEPKFEVMIRLGVSAQNSLNVTDLTLREAREVAATLIALADEIEDANTIGKRYSRPVPVSEIDKYLKAEWEYVDPAPDLSGSMVVMKCPKAWIKLIPDNLTT